MLTKSFANLTQLSDKQKRKLAGGFSLWSFSIGASLLGSLLLQLTEFIFNVVNITTQQNNAPAATQPPAQTTTTSTPKKPVTPLLETSFFDRGKQYVRAAKYPSQTKIGFSL